MGRHLGEKADRPNCPPPGCRSLGETYRVDAVILSAALVMGAASLVGPPSRFLLDRAFIRRTRSNRPRGTVVNNMVGSFILGLITGLTVVSRVSPSAKVLLAAAFGGIYVTFSTFSLDTFKLLEENRFFRAAAKITSGLAVGLGAGAGGLAVGLAS